MEALRIPKYGYVGIGLLIAGIALTAYIAITSKWVEMLGTMMPENIIPFGIGIGLLIAGGILTGFGFKNKAKAAEVKG